MNIIAYTIDELVDPTGILPGKRFELLLTVQLEEDDDVYDPNGTGLRVIYVQQEEDERIVLSEFFQRDTGKVLDFDLSEEEKLEIERFCHEQLRANHNQL